jgi:hypothetical protein
MAKEIELPDGAIAEFPDEMPDEEIVSILRRQYAPNTSSAESSNEMKRLKSRQDARLAENYRASANKLSLFPKAIQDLQVGIGHGLDRVNLGIKSLVPGLDLSESEKQRLAQGQAAVAEGGGLSDVGQFASEMAATGGPASGIAKGVGWAASKLPLAANAGQVGGRVFNLGTAGRAGVEGGVAAGALAPLGGDSRLSSVASGAIGGAALPASVALTVPPVRWARKEFTNAPESVAERGYDVLERTLGPQALSEAVGDVQYYIGTNPLPLSTAAVARNPNLAQLERGARARGAASDWTIHDERVNSQIWDNLQSKLDRSIKAGVAREQAVPALMAEGKAQLDRMPLKEKTRDQLVNQINKLLASSEAIANPDVRKALNESLTAVTHQDASLGVLPQLYWALNEAAGGSTAIAQLRGLVRKAADDGSKGVFSKLMDDYGKLQDKVKQSEAATSIVRELATDQGVPVTRKVAGGRPVVEELRLRKALAKYGEQPGGGTTLRPTDRRGIESVLEDLSNHELYKNSPGATGLDVTNLDSIIASGRRNPIYLVPFLRGLVRKVTDPLDEATKKVVDNALRNPEEFMRLVDQKSHFEAPLSDRERFLLQLLRSQGQALGVTSAQGGE